MVDEVSTSMKLGVLMSVTAVFLSSVLVILVLGINLLHGFGSGIDDVTTQSANAQISSLSTEPYVAGPICYTSLLSSINSVDVDIIVKEGKADSVDFNVNNGTIIDPSVLVTESTVGFNGYLYRLGGSGYEFLDETSYLFTQCASKFYKVHVYNGKLKGTFKTIVFEEVDK